MKQAADLTRALQAAVDPAKAALFPRFFKAGPGQYAEGDKFLGISVPHVRAAVKPYLALSLTEVEKLLTSKWHEERLAALYILVAQYARGTTAEQQAIYTFYLNHTKHINNWDLVDTSAEFIVGPWLDGRPEKMQVLEKLAHSSSLWERRIAMLATFDYIRKGRSEEALDIAKLLLHDDHDLIQKAVGWMLREVGKRVDRQVLLTFLDAHAATMPRTSLRYAIEHLPPPQRLHYMTLKATSRPA